MARRPSATCISCSRQEQCHRVGSTCPQSTRQEWRGCPNARAGCGSCCRHETGHANSHHGHERLLCSNCKWQHREQVRRHRCLMAPTSQVFLEFVTQAEIGVVSNDNMPTMLLCATNSLFHCAGSMLFSHSLLGFHSGITKIMLDLGHAWPRKWHV